MTYIVELDSPLMPRWVEASSVEVAADGRLHVWKTTVRGSGCMRLPADITYAPRAWLSYERIPTRRNQHDNTT